MPEDCLKSCKIAYRLGVLEMRESVMSLQAVAHDDMVRISESIAGLREALRLRGLEYRDNHTKHGYSLVEPYHYWYQVGRVDIMNVLSIDAVLHNAVSAHVERHYPYLIDEVV